MRASDEKDNSNNKEKRNPARRWILAAAILTALGIAAVTVGYGVFMKNSETKDMKRSGFTTERFGDNVYFFREEDDHAAIQELIDEIYRKQETNQFGPERIALCFFPGDYSDIAVNVGFYTQVLGLGVLPTDVKIGNLSCPATWLGDAYNHNATCNFWRSVENVELLSNTLWAVSQATDMRRVQVDGALYLHDDYGWASGGFLSDSIVTSMIDSGSQQQWLSRNNEYRAWMGENWNMVFVGDVGAPTGTWPGRAYTAVEKAPRIQEKPYLTWTDPEHPENAGIVIPELREDAIGITWGEGSTLPEVSPLSDWYIAKPEADTADTLTAAISAGKNLLLTPGIYEVDHPVEITRDDTVILGLGLATFKAVSGNVCLETNASHLRLAGILFDAGPAAVDGEEKGTVSPNLLYIGGGEDVTLSDLYFRVGGTPADAPATAERCLTVDADHVITDNLWVWRADHGDQVAWDKNVTKNGIVINGDDCIAYALMVEHFHEYQTVWNGENGQLYMYQSEIPYDVPSASVWMSRNGTRAGFSSLYVDDAVKSFHGEAIGIYLYNRDAAVPLESAVEAPDTPGVSFHHVITVMLTGNPGMHHVINESGGSVLTPGATAKVIDYCNGEVR